MRKALSIRPVRPDEDGGTSDRWIATWYGLGVPGYDGSGPTIETALAMLVQQMGEALDRKNA